MHKFNIGDILIRTSYCYKMPDQVPPSSGFALGSVLKITDIQGNKYLYTYLYPFTATFQDEIVIVEKTCTSVSELGKLLYA